MIAFNPDSTLLAEIGCTDIFPIIFLIPGYDRCVTVENHIAIVLRNAGTVAIAGLLAETYRDRFDGKIRQEILVNMVSEQLMNAAEHGNRRDSKKYVAIALWLGEEGILFAYRDEGAYFSLPETKRMFESRARISSTRMDNTTGGHGIPHLREAARTICVATDENTLYATYVF